ncbi:uncharacterized protein LOC106362793 [Brassica napus]|uniref:uncharacterized protein LOC106362793 n=1 Tax=Brassica napus TaxID=3708 RepID=UPI002078CAA3|nr:uncharacterized protein LOC106362793 [Brassica napus]
MADLLQKAISTMSIEDEAPLVLPDSPQFIVCDENATSLMGRLLNPECQNMARMIDYMPTAWRVFGRVRGIALSRDRFQFIFQREEDLQTVLKDRPWSYNHWAMVLERWTASPPENFLGTMEIWIRIRNIPAYHFTIGTMDRLASEVGKVEEIAYDPKVSHFKDYVRAKVTFNVENPAKASRKLSTKSGGTVDIEFEYEKIHKRCFHCLRLTHEKIRCPLLRRGAGGAKIRDGTSGPNAVNPHSVAVAPPPLKVPQLEGPPGFPPLFPELSLEEQKMAMLYISHADETERRARIERVRQGIAENARESAMRMAKITTELDKGKGHVYLYPGVTGRSEKERTLRFSEHNSRELEDTGEDGECSDTNSVTFSAPAMISTGFQLGPSSEGRVSRNANSNASKGQRKRPSSWKRKLAPRNSMALVSIVSEEEPQPSGPCSKRKQNSSVPLSDNKTPRHTESSVASVLKPLPSQ